MSRELWPFYEQELRFLREQAREFSREYGREAGFLRLENTGRSTDPHVERLIQAVALLSARIRLKIDDDFPELTDSLLSLLAPHYLAPLPSMLTAQFVPQAGAELVNGLTVPRHTSFKTTPPVEGMECEFRTVYPVRLWPIRVADASLKGPPYIDFQEIMRDVSIPAGGSKARLRLTFDIQSGGPFESLALGNPEAERGAIQANCLRLFLDDSVTQNAMTIYELLNNNLTAVIFRQPGSLNVAEIPVEEALKPVGFGMRWAGNRSEIPENQDESALPYPDRVFPGYRLLSEYFAYRDKFLYIDLYGWDRARKLGILNGSTVEVHLFFNQQAGPELERTVSKQTFRLGCVPMINLFSMKSTDGVPIGPQKYEFTLTPNREHPLSHEVYSVDEVYYRSESGKEVQYEPFYSFKHQNKDSGRRYWLSRRRASSRFDDRGTEIDLQFVDADYNPRGPETTAVVLAKVTCSNRDLPVRLGQSKGVWGLRPVGMVVPADIRILRDPSPSLRPTQKRSETVTYPDGHRDEVDLGRRMSYWKLISHLGLNHLSITDDLEGLAAIREYLSLYDFSDDANPDPRQVAQQVRDGVLRVGSKREVAFVSGDMVGGYTRGIEVLLELDEEKYVGIGSYLFASVMERFFALYTSINSFTRTVYRTKQRGHIRTWPARAGHQPLI